MNRELVVKSATSGHSEFLIFLADIFKVSLYSALQPFDQNIGSQLAPFYKSESLSSALYFSQHVPFMSTVITIDIGGHTSDISIFQDQKLLWRSSFIILE